MAIFNSELFVYQRVTTVKSIRTRLELHCLSHELFTNDCTLSGHQAWQWKSPHLWMIFFPFQRPFSLRFSGPAMIDDTPQGQKEQQKSAWLETTTKIRRVRNNKISWMVN